MAFHLYIAGPTCFRPNAKAIGQHYLEICRRHGAVGLYPISDDDALDLSADDPDGNARKIFELNLWKLRTSDAVIADMTPFRGPGMDGGTSFEIGAAYMIGKPIVGHGPAETYMSKVTSWASTSFPNWKPERSAADDTIYCPEGMAIEDLGGRENLMMDKAIRAYAADFEQAVILAIDILSRGGTSS